MPDARFFSPEGPFTLNELSQLCGAEIANSSDGDRIFLSVAPLQDAGPRDLSFLDNKAYVDAFATTSAGCCIVAPEHAYLAPSGAALLLTKEPYLAYAQCASAYYPKTEDGYIPALAEENIHPSAEIGAGTLIAPSAVIGPFAKIGENCRISPNAYIGKGVMIGDNCRIGPSVSLQYCILGANVILFAGVRIGEAGFGFARGPQGAVTVPQVGRVIIEDFVEIGANSTIDRGSGPDTVIGAGTRIDDLVQIGHNVRIGSGCIVVSQSGVAGSTQIGNGVQIGGQSAVAGHLTVGDGAMIAAKTGVLKDIPPGVTVCGMPAVPIKQYFRQVAMVSRLAKKKGK